MKQVTPNTEFIIGIDFGHGETSAAFYNLKTQDKFDIDILPGLKVIKSAVAIVEQEGKEAILVGDAAIQYAPIAKDFQVSFKKRPSEMTKTERNRMISFMKGVYAGILDRHPDYKTRDHIVYIARPSQDKLWKAEENAYLALAEEAGIPVAGIQKESRAAYFRARTQPDSKIDTLVKNGVLIVDFGSSTVDFTYLNDSLTAPIDDGRPLGASMVEQTILEYALSHPNDLTMPRFAQLYGYNEGSNPYNQLLYKFREAKEAFYGKKLPKFQVMFDYGDLTSSEKEQLSGLGGISLSRSEIETILGKNTKNGYIQRVKEAVLAFKTEKLKNNKVVCVYLTGGASRMDFVREIFMEVFGLDEAHCPQDDNPSVIVSQGVAHLSYADVKAKERESDLKHLADSAINSFNWEDNFNSIVRSSIKSKIIEKAKNIMIAYRDGLVGEYLDLKDNYSPAGEYIMMEYSDKKNGFQMVRNIRGLNNKIKNEFSSLVHTDFGIECESMITKSILDAVIEKLKQALSAFEYTPESSQKFHLTGLSASITSSGADELSEKFTAEGDGHIVYDAVSSCFLMMASWKVYKDRWDRDRKQHYNYYLSNYSNIFSDYGWSQFLKNRISISGINTAKQQTRQYIDNIIEEYVSYAKLAMFFK